MSVNKGMVHIHMGISCSHEKQLPANCYGKHRSEAGEECGGITVRVVTKAVAVEEMRSSKPDEEDAETVRDSASLGSVISSNGDAGKEPREG